jgi:hypothetical protein
MAKYPETTVIKETAATDGGRKVTVGFLRKHGETVSVDDQLGTREFTITSGALRALEEVNVRLEEILRSLGDKPATKIKTMNPNMAVYLYTRRIEPQNLPMTEIVLDETTVRGLLRKRFGRKLA